MPWKEVLVSEARVRFVLACREKGQSFTRLCRGFGISRKCGYKWLKRYRQGGVRALGEASRRPHYCAKAYRCFWRERLCRAREARPSWGPKKLRWQLQKTFPRAKRVPAVSTLGLWLAQSNLAGKRKRRARPGPVLPWRRLRIARRCNEVWSVDFKGWFRTGDQRRCEPLSVRDVHSRFVLAIVLLPNQSERAVRPGTASGFSPLWFAKSDPSRQRSAFRGQGSIGTLAPECLVAAPGHCGRVYPASASSGQRSTRTNASYSESRDSHSPGWQLPGPEASDRSVDRLLQPSASSRSVGTASAGAFLSAQCSWHSATDQRSEISQEVGSAPCPQPRPDQMAWASAFCGAGFCRPIAGIEKRGQQQPRSFPRAPFAWIALRARFGGNETSLDWPSDLMLRACPPLEANEAAWESAPDQTAAPPSSCWLVCSGALHPARGQKCYPCH